MIFSIDDVYEIQSESENVNFQIAVSVDRCPRCVFFFAENRGILIFLFFYKSTTIVFQCRIFPLIVLKSRKTEAVSIRESKNMKNTDKAELK